MTRLAILASLAVALVLPSLALASAPPAGTYTTKIATPPELKGTWALTFTKQATYTITLNGKLAIRGHSAGGAKLLFTKETGPKACPTVGKYTWKRTGKTLTFTKLSDPCVGREFVLGHVFTVRS